MYVRFTFATLAVVLCVVSLKQGMDNYVGWRSMKRIQSRCCFQSEASCQNFKILAKSRPCLVGGCWHCPKHHPKPRRCDANHGDDWMLSQASCLSINQAASTGHPNSSDEHISCTAPAHLCRSSWIVPRLPSFLEMPQNPHVLLTFDNVRNPLRLPCKTTLNVQKCSEPLSFFAILTLKCASRHNGVQVRSWGALYILRSKCASGYNGVHFFDISTSQVLRSRGALYILTWERASRVHFFDISKSAPNISERAVVLAFSLANVLRATTAFNFSSLIWPAGSAPVALASLLFDPPEPQIIRKTHCFATFLPLRAPGSSFFWDFFLLSLFWFSVFVSSLLCISSVHIVGSLTSKLPSIIYIDHLFDRLWPLDITRDSYVADRRILDICCFCFCRAHCSILA